MIEFYVAKDPHTELIIMSAYVGTFPIGSLRVTVEEFKRLLEVLDKFATTGILQRG